MAPLNTHTARPVDDTATAELHATTTPKRTVRRPRAGLGLRSAPSSRVAYGLGVATVSSLALVNLLAGGPAASATPTSESPSLAVAAALGIEGSGVDVPAMEEPQLLEQLAASRSERDAERTAAASAQAQAEQAAVEAKAEAEAAAKAAAEAEAEAAAEAEAEAAAAAERASAAKEAVAENDAKEAQAATAAVASTAVSIIAKITNSAGAVRSQTQAAANAVVSNVPGAGGITIGGTRASATDPGGHPSGLALDYMVGTSNVALGNAIVDYHIANWEALGVDYLIYRQRMLSSPNGNWTSMEDRGSATANHMDHPHVNYRG